MIDFNQSIIPYYSPISSKGGSRRKLKNRIHSKNRRTRNNKRNNKSRTRRIYR
jgi:hypothetical protein